MDVFAANDLAGFSTIGGSPTETTTAGLYDSTYTDRAIQLLNAATVRSARFINPTTGANVSLTSGWAHFELSYFVNTNGSSNGCCYLVNSSGTRVVRIFADDSGNLRLDYWNGSSWVTGASTYAVGESTLAEIDLNFVCGASGSLELYVDQASALTVSGLNAAVDNAAYIEFADFNTIINAEVRVSQVLVTEETTIGAKVSSLIPNANGANTAWSGDYTAIVETGYDDTDYIESTSAGEKESYGASNITNPYATGVISSVWFAARAKLGAASPTNIKALVRSNSTDYPAGYNFPNLNSSSFEPSTTAFTTDPDTGVGWTLSGINAAEVGFQSAA